ncbi:MAG: B12-binding domain-containing protein [Cytophagaceae bacterium]|nr:B12-binding domain-containing protein [Cytophagaceae bacterium]
MENEVESYAINNMILAMLNFDTRLFSETYQLLIKEKSFKEILYNTFFPFLYQIGLLWQTGSLNPAHEHFISNLIKQKLLLNIEKLEFNNAEDDDIYVLFLPHKEIHEIGLLAVNFELKLLSKNTIYLGESIPVGDLVELANKSARIHFISYFTIYPEDEILEDYLVDFQKSILNNKSHKLWIGGYKARFVSDFNLENVNPFENIQELIKKISE